ncbi:MULTISPECIES: class I adenylate-forming enzyme family protein [Comamonas]|uniref:Acyl--CoA ligase n=1 Tax=Comamonas thiooxydans TaxID=363952 RepID=A0AA42Q224_9BURK|nr:MULTISPECIES: class I adenylate-forming enzyme family protein [Comamonas]BCX54083.1 O-succinylbenzoic acid--CoA ligase [Comamonas testosteroni]KKI14069.1 AMP-binding protein [Comamonas thiooxydans]MDH1254748.1 acyl--CoA ligase [Comamonas thiooxydans]MDH1334886.1 acyl--CoA ligase [Comamonas thiooxydans]MDH1476203.1 acyl--CoA ligase [Comamonas thiooxydans]
MSDALVSMGEKIRNIRAQLTSQGAPFEVQQVTLSDGRSVAAYRNAFQNLAQVIDAGRVHGAAEFMVYGEDRWTFDRFFAAADALASRLQKQCGIKPGDRVAIAMRNRPEWAVAFAAIALLGAVPVPLNSFGLSSELMANLEDTRPVMLICDADRHARISQAIAQTAIKVVVVDGEGGDISWSELTAGGHDGFVSPQLSADEPALILFTSGATSRAKGVESTHRAVCQGIFNIDFIGAVAAMTSPDAIAAIMARQLQPTILSAVPLFHVSGLHAQLLVSLRHGRRLIFVHRWEPEKAAELIRKEKVTQFNGAPSMVQQLIGLPGFEQPESSGNLSGVGFGGAGLHPRLIDEVLAKFKGRMSGIGFGLTESNGVCAGSSGRMFEAHPRSSGVLSPIIEVRIADLDGTALPIGEPGEIWLRGVTLMERYCGDAEATAKAMQGGWFHTGDIGVLDDEGFLTIVDRIKDVINRSGEKIAAAEVEACLLQHEALEEAAVFSMPHEVTGEQVVAVVVGKTGSQVTPELLREFVAQRLAGYKVPSRIVVRAEPLPRNPAGKMLKASIRKECAHLLT